MAKFMEFHPLFRSCSYSSLIYHSKSLMFTSSTSLVIKEGQRLALPKNHQAVLKTAEANLAQAQADNHGEDGIFTYIETPKMAQFCR